MKPQNSVKTVKNIKMLLKKKAEYKKNLDELTDRAKVRLREETGSLKSHDADTNVFPEINLVQITTTRKMIAKLEQAIALAEKGKYGICKDCGKPIPSDRLKAVPFTDRCVACKEATERKDTIIISGTPFRNSRPQAIIV
jgi:DnaK suppressor protein